jgi:hypothetical protein
MATKTQRRVTNGAGNFLIRIDSSFFSRWSGDGRACGVAVPSAAHHFADYAEADAVCQQVRALGHTLAYVTDIFGREIDMAALAKERERLDAKYRKFWGV